MRNSRPEALLLDLDETILTSDADACWRQAFEELADSLESPVPAAELLEALFECRDQFWHEPSIKAAQARGQLNLTQAREKILINAFRKVGIWKTERAFEIAVEVGRRIDATLKPFPGAVEKLTEARTLGIPMALITNGSSERQREKIAQFDLECFFKVIVIEGEMGFGKPDPRVFEHALDTIKASPAKSWMIGDRLDFDVAPAQALGLRGIWRARPGTACRHLGRVSPDETLASLADLKLVR